MGVEAGFVDYNMMRELKAQYDVNGDGRLQMQEFLEILCPTGFRPNLATRKVVDKVGRHMSVVNATLPDGVDLSAWFYDDEMRKLPSDLWECLWKPSTSHPLLAKP